MILQNFGYEDFTDALFFFEVFSIFWRNLSFDFFQKLDF